MATITSKSRVELDQIAGHKDKALALAYEMLCQIQAGNDFDTVDFLHRKAAIAAALDRAVHPWEA
jgi:hypothetical protein